MYNVHIDVDSLVYIYVYVGSRTIFFPVVKCTLIGKWKVGRVRNSGTHVLKTILQLINCIFSSSLNGFQTFC